MRDPDLRLYAVLDPERCAGREPVQLLRAALDGGATLVQLRAKRLDTAAFVDLARSAVDICQEFHVPLLINDRVDVALAASADGVHVGQTDMAVADARRLLGEDAMIGVTVHHAHEAKGVDPSAADYAGIGPIYVTPSKDPGDPPIGPAGLTALKRDLGEFPICGIAGIGFENAAPVIEAGADGIAVISEIFMAEDVTAATKRLRSIVDRALAGENA